MAVKLVASRLLVQNMWEERGISFDGNWLRRSNAEVDVSSELPPIKCACHLMIPLTSSCVPCPRGLTLNILKNGIKYIFKHKVVFYTAMSSQYVGLEERLPNRAAWAIWRSPRGSGNSQLQFGNWQELNAMVCDGDVLYNVKIHIWVFSEAVAFKQFKSLSSYAPCLSENEEHASAVGISDNKPWMMPC